jgi:hypothetical protein
MTGLAKLSLAALVLALPATGFAQSADSKYCAALGAQYDRYVNNVNMGRSVATPSARIEGAKANCANNPAAAIPVLEKALTDAKVQLPPRT